MRLLYALLLLLITSNPIFGQHHRMDSLQKVAETHPLDTIRLKAYVTLAKWFAQRDSIRTKKYIARGTELAQQLDDEQSKLALQIQYGLLLANNSQYEKAHAIYQEVLEKSKRQQLPIIQAGVLIEFANDYIQRNNYVKAYSYLEESLSICEEIDYKIGIARAISLIGFIQFRKHEYSKANTSIAKGLKICQQMGDKELEGNIFNIGGIIFMQRRNYPQALRFFKKSLVIKQKMDDKKGMALCINNIAMVHKQQGQYSKARTYYEKSYEIFKQLENTTGISLPLSNLGKIYKSEGNYDRALFFLKKGLQIYQQEENHVKLTRTLTEIGTIYILLQSEDSAQYYFKEGIVACKAFKLTRKLLDHYGLYGMAYRNQGQLPKAFDSYFEGLKVAEEVKDTLQMGWAYGEIAEVHEIQNNFEEALLYQNKALACFQAINRITDIAATQNLIGRLLYQNGKYSDALGYSRQALRTYHTLQDSCNFDICLLQMGKSYYALQEIDSAFIVLEKARKQAAKCLNKSNFASIYIELGKIYQTKQQNTSAFQAFEQALVHAQSSQNRAVIKKAAEYLHPIYQQRGQFQKAYEVLNLYQSSKDSLFNEENTRKLVQKEMQYAHDKEIQQQELQQQQQKAALERQRWMTYGVTGICLALLSLALAIYRNFRNKQKANLLLIQSNDKIRQRNEEIQQQNEEIVSQRDYIQEQAEELEASYDKLKKLDTMKRELTGMIVHDLKNPLAFITQNSMQKAVKQASHQMLNMVLNMLDTQKMEEAQLKVDLQPVGVNYLLAQATSQVVFLANQRNIKLLVSELVQGSAVLADHELIERVIVNLLTNAIKFSPLNSELRLESRQSPNSKNQLRLLVIDQGEGISPERLPTIFSKFGQIEAKKSGNVRSTGLGLSFCKLATEAQGGVIGVESAVQQGTTFWVDMPLSQKGSSSTAELDSLQVVLKDDNNANIVLPNEHRHTLEPYLELLRNTNVYNFSAVEGILEKIHEQEPAILQWKQALEQALENCNNELYTSLLE